MRRSLTILALGALLAVAIHAGPTAESDRGPEAARHMEFLEWEAGEWEAEVRLVADSPQASPKRYRAEQTDRIGGCGLWLITDMRMLPGQDGSEAPPYEGHGVLGFDPAKNRLVGVWIDSKTDWLGVAEGTLDPLGRQLTLEVEGRNPATGEPMPQRFVTTRLGQDRRRLEISVPAPDGDWFQVATIDYTRRK